jgi:uncharacterized protein YbjT (DUF2867 family)
LSGQRILLTGGSGMIGGLVLRRALERPDVAKVTSLGRRPCGVAHAKLIEIVHDDFTNFAGAEHAFERQDAAIYCLGAYTGAVPDDEFRRITTDCTVAFAAALEAASPGAAFCFLSGQGADPTGRSRIPFARYKGMAENDLRERAFSPLHIFRPGYIYPVEPRPEPNRLYAMFRAVYPLLRLVHPNVGLPSDDLAQSMLEAALRGTPGHDGPVLENRDIRRLTATTR